ncbi:MAG TPA: hypothetical protein PKH77_01135 [Anaerolineae bacterium]|nr:hypothetical protein [Anaerolineae bacterium]
MSGMPGIVAVLGNLLTRLPLILVWLVMGILAVVRWDRHPRKSLLTLLAVVILFLQAVVGTFLNIRLSLLMSTSGASRIALWLTLLNIGGALVSAGAWGLLAAALFMEED